MLGRQGLIAQTQALSGRAAHGVQQHIRLAQERVQDLAPLWRLKVGHDAALVAVIAQKEGAHLGAALGAHHPGTVAFWRLELDHLCAHVAQVLARQRPEDDGGDFEDAHPLQRPGDGHGVTGGKPAALCRCTWPAFPTLKRLR